jgi:Tfp pilus assembly protein PilF
MAVQVLCTRLSRVLVVAAGTILAAGWAVSVWAGEETARVEFDCKLASNGHLRDPWIVELRQPTGEPARIVSGFGGTTFHLKDLDPGIYTVCIFGTQNRRSCESVDLTPPPNKRSYRVKKSFSVPDRILNVGSLNTITASKLGIPESARAELHRAEEAQLRGDPQEAEQHLKKAIQIDPDYSDALNNLGIYYHRKREFEKSIQCFEKVTTLDPGFYGGWVNLAGSLISQGKFHQAKAASLKAYSLRPDDTRVVSQTALAYFYLHDVENAKKFFQKVIEMDPGSPVEPQLYLAHLALAEQDKQEAADYIRQFLTIHPNAPKAEHLKETLARINSLSFTSAAGLEGMKQ